MLKHCYKHIIVKLKSAVTISSTKVTDINEKGKQLPLFIIVKLFIIRSIRTRSRSVPMKGAITMSAIDNIIKKINEILQTLEEHQLRYIHSFLEKMFGSR